MLYLAEASQFLGLMHNGLGGVVDAHRVAPAGRGGATTPFALRFREIHRNDELLVSLPRNTPHGTVAPPSPRCVCLVAQSLPLKALAAVLGGVVTEAVSDNHRDDTAEWLRFIQRAAWRTPQEFRLLDSQDSVASIPSLYGTDAIAADCAEDDEYRHGLPANQLGYTDYVEGYRRAQSSDHWLVDGAHALAQALCRPDQASFALSFVLELPSWSFWCHRPARDQERFFAAAGKLLETLLRGGLRHLGLHGDARYATLLRRALRPQADAALAANVVALELGGGLEALACGPDLAWCFPHMRYLGCRLWRAGDVLRHPAVGKSSSDGMGAGRSGDNSADAPWRHTPPRKRARTGVSSPSSFVFTANAIESPPSSASPSAVAPGGAGDLAMLVSQADLTSEGWRSLAEGVATAGLCLRTVGLVAHNDSLLPSVTAALRATLPDLRVVDATQDQGGDDDHENDATDAKAVAFASDPTGGLPSPVWRAALRDFLTRGTPSVSFSSLYGRHMRRSFGATNVSLPVVSENAAASGNRSFSDADAAANDRAPLTRFPTTDSARSTPPADAPPLSRDVSCHGALAVVLADAAVSVDDVSNVAEEARSLHLRRGVCPARTTLPVHAPCPTSLRENSLFQLPSPVRDDGVAVVLLRARFAAGVVRSAATPLSSCRDWDRLTDTAPSTGSPEEDDQDDGDQGEERVLPSESTSRRSFAFSQSTALATPPLSWDTPWLTLVVARAPNFAAHVVADGPLPEFVGRWAGALRAVCCPETRWSGCGEFLDACHTLWTRQIDALSLAAQDGGDEGATTTKSESLAAATRLFAIDWRFPGLRLPDDSLPPSQDLLEMTARSYAQTAGLDVRVFKATAKEDNEADNATYFVAMASGHSTPLPPSPGQRPFSHPVLTLSISNQ